jgi:hypothetical protein
MLDPTSLQSPPSAFFCAVALLHQLDNDVILLDDILFQQANPSVLGLLDTSVDGLPKGRLGLV